MRTILFVFLLLVGFVGLTQVYQPTIHLDKESGLLQNTVWAIEEDQFYRIWIGTQEGLQFYDGYSLTTIPEIRESVMALFHHDSSMYCLTSSSLYKINEISLSLETRKLQKTDYYLHNFNNNRLSIFSTDGSKTANFDLNLNLIDSLPTHKAKLFSCSQRIGQYMIEGNHNGLNYSYQPTIDHLPDGMVFQVASKRPKPLTTQYCSQLLSYGKNGGFVATHNGLLEIKTTDEQIKIQNHFEGTRIEELFLDHNQNIWVGMAGNGIFMIHHNTLHSEYFPLTPLKKENIYSWDLMQVDSLLYVATSQGIQVLGSKQTHLPIELATQNTMCFSMSSADNFVLIGTGNQGVLKYHNNTLTTVYSNSEEVLDNTIIQIIKNEKGILANSKRSFIQFDENGQFMYSKPFPFNNDLTYVMHTLITDYGYLVATTIGIFKLDFDFNLIPDSPNKPTHSVSMLTHFQNEIWAATFDSGIVNFTTEKVLSEQLVGNSFLTLLNHKNQSLWSSSHSGFFSYEPPYIRHFDIENGFNISEYDQLSAHQDSNGIIYFGGIGGVVKFDPEDLHLFPSYPEILTYYDNKLLDINSHIKLAFDKSEISLEINPVILSDRNYFKVEVVFNDSSILILGPQKIVLKMPFKDSKILLKVTDLVHHKSRISEFNVHRQLPFWKKTWFILLSIILFILLVIGIISFIGFLKTRKLLKKEQADKKITEERLRISKELHDNIGARITHIISSLDVEMYHRKEDAKSIETINSFARETMTQLRETIWAVSDKTIFFSEFALRLEQYINQVNSLSISNITFKQDPITDFELNPIQTINFYRIIQEAVNNAVKYAKASTITVRVKSFENIVTIQVQDNGQGFDTNSTHGTGLNGMQGRANEANGNTNIESNSDGTTITLTF